MSDHIEEVVLKAEKCFYDAMQSGKWKLIEESIVPPVRMEKVIEWINKSLWYREEDIYRHFFVGGGYDIPDRERVLYQLYTSILGGSLEDVKNACEQLDEKHIEEIDSMPYVYTFVYDLCATRGYTNVLNFLIDKFKMHPDTLDVLLREMSEEVSTDGRKSAAIETLLSSSFPDDVLQHQIHLLKENKGECKDEKIRAQVQIKVMKEAERRGISLQD